jgi:hypothetical protein
VTRPVDDPTANLPRAVWRRLTAECERCDHRWAEHDRSGVETCGECLYEVEHGELPDGRTPCSEPIPEVLFARPTTRELERAAPLHRKVLLRIGRGVGRVVEAFFDAW